MKIEFPALQSEPLIYFLVHGGVFVLVLGALFFTLGLWFGATIWGRYKVQTKALQSENEAQRQEVATLKRKLAEQAMRPATGHLPPISHLLTEVLPSVSEIFPERKFEYPALAALSAPEAEIKAPLVAKPETPVAPKPTIKAKPKKITPEITPPLPVIAEEADETADLEPFGFLIAEPVEMPVAAAPAGSALTSIIKGSTTAPLTAAPVLTLLPEIPIISPEVDPALGLLYRQAPPDADDLTKIKGIATVLEKRLHELGVHTYRQIASWEENHVREFSSRLAFKDRIAREKWVEQARALNESRQSA
jgi:hypothetical protein